MKPIYNALFAAVSMTMVLACSENQFENEATQPDQSVSARVSGQGNEDKCATMKVLEEKIKENPGLAKKLEAIEAQAQRFAANQKNGSGSGKPGGGTSGGGTSTPYTGTVTIPVYVHVIYNTTQQNISDAQIQSQIDVLNADFSKTNSDFNNNSGFSGVADNLDIRFTWSTANLIRKASSKTSWGTRDDMKYSRKGGSDAVPGFLNIWVCNIGGGILGYAQFPGGSASTDGVVVGPNYFGSKNSSGSSSFYLSTPFNLGRTATHEVGHWLNLRHIWGDGGCGVDDYVADTPMSDSPNYGCPGTVIKCGNTNMTMNYMDYTDDACMYMFTTGQKTRTRALFASDGARSNFVITP